MRNLVPIIHLQPVKLIYVCAKLFNYIKTLKTALFKWIFHQTVTQKCLSTESTKCELQYYTVPAYYVQCLASALKIVELKFYCIIRSAFYYLGNDKSFFSLTL